MKGRSMKKTAGIAKLFRLVREEHGVELLEFALVLPVLILLLFGVFQIGYTMYVYHFTTYAAEEGARYAAVRGQTWSTNTPVSCATAAQYECTATPAMIQSYVQSLATPGIVSTNLTIDETSTDVWPGLNPDGNNTNCTPNTNSRGCLVVVKVNYAFNSVPTVKMVGFFPYMKLSSMTMTATSKSVIQE